MATIEELESALKKAHAAGNVEHARAFASEIRKMRSQAPVGSEPASSVTGAGAPPASTNPTDGMSGFERFAAGVGKSMVDTYRGAKQLGTEAIRAAAGDYTGLTSGENAVTRWADRSLEAQQAEVDQARRLDAPLMETGAGTAGNIAGYGAQLLVPGGAALRGAAGGNRLAQLAAGTLLPRTVAGNAAQGAVMGGAQPVATGENRLANLAMGGGFGAAGAGIAQGVGNVGRSARGAIEPHVREVFEAARQRGIDLMPAQISDSRPMRIAQSVLRSVPFTGAQARYDAQVGAFNRELAGAVGETAPVLNSQVYAAAKQRQSQEFTDLTSRNALQVTPQLVQSLTNIADGSRMAGDQVSQQVQSAIDALYAQAVSGPNGVTIPGAAYQAFDSQLGSIMKSGGTPAHFLGHVQSAVRRAMDGSISPEDAQAWQRLRTEYGNRKTLAPLVAKASDGPISPPQVLGAVTNSKSAKERMASGTRGELGELARIGQRMKEPPSSGTSERTVMAALMGGGAVVDPVSGGLTALGLNALARGLDSRALARFMMRENPGMTLEVAEQIIRGAANPVGQNRLAERPLEIDIVGGTPVDRRQMEQELQALGR